MLHAKKTGISSCHLGLWLVPGGGTWVFFGWVCAARDSKLAPHSKKYFPLKLIPLLEMAQFFKPRSRIHPKTDTPF